MEFGECGFSFLDTFLPKLHFRAQSSLCHMLFHAYLLLSVMVILCPLQLACSTDSCEEVNKSHFSAACKRTREEIEEIKNGPDLVSSLKFKM